MIFNTGKKHRSRKLPPPNYFELAFQARLAQAQSGINKKKE